MNGKQECEYCECGLYPKIVKGELVCTKPGNHKYVPWSKRPPARDRIGKYSGRSTKYKGGYND